MSASPQNPLRPLDGVRVVPFDQLLRVDLNIIPLALVDRVDVLTGGASSTYGADAVGAIEFQADCTSAISASASRSIAGSLARLASTRRRCR